MAGILELLLVHMDRFNWAYLARPDASELHYVVCGMFTKFERVRGNCRIAAMNQPSYAFAQVACISI